MLNNINFLCEIGTEEIPSGYILPAIKSFDKILKQKLEEFRINFTNIDVYATPRRFVIGVSNLSLQQREEEIEIKGPSVSVAYDENNHPTKAILGFLKANDLSADNIYNKKTKKGEYIHSRKKLTAKKTTEIIPIILEFMIKNINFPKRMRWSDLKTTFPRPISYFLILFNNEIVPFTSSKINSSNLTRGHFIQSNKMIKINSISEYEKTLRNNNIFLDHVKRKEFIYNELINAAKKIDGIVIDDDNLLNTVTFLVENPSVLLCNFDKLFLNIPDIVLISEMREHQKCFALKDQDGNLMPNFLTVSNNPPSDNIKKGYERVISARFSDAKFFFNEDRKKKLIDRVDSLKSVLFHKELGSIYDKIKRMEFIADSISTKLRINNTIIKKIKRALLLSKTDLVTEMVIEFPSLQGKIGKIYAILDGEDEEIANAINDHYKPTFQGEALSPNLVSTVASLSEKIDNILASYSVGNIPKGSEDPYALKRQATAIVEILLENKINLNIKSVLEEVSPNYNIEKNIIDKILNFITARVRTIFLAKGLKFDEIDACLSIKYYDFLELYRRARSINEFRKHDKFNQMLLSFKRMNNISSIFKQKNPDYNLIFNNKFIDTDYEKDLYLFFETKENLIDQYITSNQYIKLFELLINGKSIIDSFFDNVMVMVEDVSIRDNRLALLERILHSFKNLLDFSKILE